jgi:hypothetical protein
MHEYLLQAHNHGFAYAYQQCAAGEGLQVADGREKLKYVWMAI